MRSLLVALLAVFCLALIVAPATACINDREVIQAEKEFKSRYIEQPASVPQYQPEQGTPSHLLVFGGAGSVLVLSALVLGFVWPKKA